MIENAGGYYLSKYNAIIDDRVSLVYSDFLMSWAKRSERRETLDYCSEFQSFLLRNLWEESILIAVYPVAHNAV